MDPHPFGLDGTRRVLYLCDVEIYSRDRLRRRVYAPASNAKLLGCLFHFVGNPTLLSENNGHDYEFGQFLYSLYSNYDDQYQERV